MENEWRPAYTVSIKRMLMVFDLYRSFAGLRMTTKRKRVILNAVKNLYESPVNDIIIEKTNVLHSRRGDPAWSPACRAAATIPVPCCLLPVPSVVSPEQIPDFSYNYHFSWVRTMERYGIIKIRMYTRGRETG